MVKSTTAVPIITTAPLTLEARNAWLRDQFAEVVGHYGELFIPRDSFYIGKTPAQRANHILQTLCTWLAIKPGYVSLEFEGAAAAKSKKHYRIFIEEDVARSELRLAATIAIALTRFWVEEKKQIHLPTEEQRALIVSASVVFGLGIVVANGLQNDEHATQLLGPIKPTEYAHILHDFLSKRRIATNTYQAYLAPWAADLLHIKKPRRPSRTVAHAYAEERHLRYQLLGIGWVVLIAIGVGLFVMAQRISPTSRQVRAAHQKTLQTQQAYNECRNKYNYDKLYTDTSDIQAERAMNAEAARCQSLKNQYEAAQVEYNDAVNN